ncbi:malate dehydrogenase, NAD-dependent [Plasmodium falciparum Santa Lucia]|uniref:L-lactate dehydrogenase n=14 Tax=Plasmodium falciparum TaxID=5833 RepID=C6KT25_PLAF7|nr:malate dehydrogenase [Plasmodium falciparum 3D7]AAQ23154.1 malate dehydrogenase [Plasmodium falciparum]ETW19634.1 malate dehydrogenase, NAD-dependent [Plasmodium falciparum Vietnam Oak-Knoll (FVO)]ETW27831.1 malate dehydrogenase, NAD-dependent [Plasmodium falciparum FCH/4]ETW37742.1 malate dehydrogenase, NAD-dependent [Plasmodium falciparum Tanzania (2000708)]ETW43957.1 malate dehydrogenase, NAD-dependent [Plasmodium falciparum NF135/5.C10]ETW53159.1 malate dehydrogenase, NAD-dependent [Pl|eukprot:XP_966170.1 malate dehydrogenase [Plasmodium falciparum 3D7]
MTKIALIGSGQIGAIVGELCLLENLGDLILYDVVPGIPQGKALDLKHFSTILGVNRNILGTNQIEDIKDADIIVITAGVQRKEGMTREDLIGVNGKIMKSVAESVKLHCSKAFVICVSNPLDIMVNVFHKFSNLPHEKICGMAGILDTSRYCSLIADKLKVSAEDVNAVILGGHGDLMVPLQRYTSVNGVPLSEFVKKNMISQNEIQEIIQKTRNMGAEIIKLAKASAAFAPAAAITKMIKSYLYNENNLFTCAVYLNGHYNCSNLFVGSTAKINNKGAHPVEFPLTKEEQDLYTESIASVQSNTQKAFDLIK